MGKPPPLLEELEDGTLLAVTVEGERDLLEPGTTLTPVQLEVLVMMDAHSTVSQVAKRVRPAIRPHLLDTLRELLERKFIRIVKEQGMYIDAGDFFTLKQTGAELAEAHAKFLRQNGYLVNLARRGVSRTRPEGRNLNVLVVDDDPDIGALLRKYFKLEGLDTQMAANRAEIEAALRRKPSPDLVLLDVHLNDIDGFHVLHKMRQHPKLDKLPVIMLTGTANREVVLKGILGGADGHITKPFKIHPLVRAVKAVLGLDYDVNEQDWDLSL